VKKSIQTVVNDGYYFNEMVLAALVKGLTSAPDNNEEQSGKDKKKKNDLPPFTDKELKVLKLLCKEYTNNEMAEALDLSPKTIEGYKSRLMEKTGAKSSIGLALFAVRNGLIRL